MSRCRRDKRDAVTDATKRIRPSSLRKRGTHCYFSIYALLGLSRILLLLIVVTILPYLPADTYRKKLTIYETPLAAMVISQFSPI